MSETVSARIFHIIKIKYYSFKNSLETDNTGKYFYTFNLSPRSIYYILIFPIYYLYNQMWSEMIFISFNCYLEINIYDLLYYYLTQRQP